VVSFVFAELFKPSFNVLSGYSVCLTEIGGSFHCLNFLTKFVAQLLSLMGGSVRFCQNF